MTEKSSARERAKLLRQRALRAPDRASLARGLSLVLERLLRDHPQWTRIAGYVPLPGELDCGLALQRARRIGRTIYYPRTLPGGHLEVAEAADQQIALAPARWGLREPRQRAMPIEALDLILVPGLRFDRHGARLGYGKGYYDRLLRRARDGGGARAPRVLGVARTAHIARSRLPTQLHDQRVDGIVTPEGLWRFY